MKPVRYFLSFITALLLALPLLAQSPSDRILLPILTPPVHGAYGSEFHTDLRIVNTSDDPVFLLGIDAKCNGFCFPHLPGQPYILEPNSEIEPDEVILNGTPGRFVIVASAEVGALSMNLRVHDETRGGLNFGTEIPIVRMRDFAINKLDLIGVPTDPRFRNTLRIYAESPIDVLVTVGNRPPVTVHLTGGITIGNLDFSKPAYAMFTNFPTGFAPVRVTIETNPGFALHPFEIPIWAFITVTNNETQAITTITPRP